jgi:hypothetical protein
MQKFGFRIKTKAGALVDNLIIQAQDLSHAESKLRQMYHHATVLESRAIDEQPSGQGMDLEGALSLIIARADPLGR